MSSASSRPADASEHRVLYRSGIMIIIALRVSPLSLYVYMRAYITYGIWCVYVCVLARVCVCVREYRGLRPPSVARTYIRDHRATLRFRRVYVRGRVIPVGERVAHCTVQPAPRIRRIIFFIAHFSLVSRSREVTVLSKGTDRDTLRILNSLSGDSSRESLVLSEGVAKP